MPTMDDCVVNGVLQFSFRVRSRATIDPNRSKGIVLQSRRTVLFLVKVKPFFILTAVAARSTGSMKVPALDEID